MEIVSKIKELGLSEKESVVYLACLQTGENTITKIARVAKQKRPTVYLSLDRLEILGLVARAVHGKKKLWSPVHPKRLKELADFRASQIENALPELLAMYKEEKGNKPIIRMMEGIEGVRNAYREAFSLLNSKHEGLWIGNIQILQERFPEVMREYNASLRKISNPHIREIIHGGPKSKEWVDETSRTASKNHKVRYADNKNFGETDQFIIENKIISFSFGKEIFVTIIESKELTQTQRVLFENLWDSIK